MTYQSSSQDDPRMTSSSSWANEPHAIQTMDLWTTMSDLAFSYWGWPLQIHPRMTSISSVIHTCHIHSWGRHFHPHAIQTMDLCGWRMTSNPPHPHLVDDRLIFMLKMTSSSYWPKTSKNETEDFRSFSVLLATTVHLLNDRVKIIPSYKVVRDLLRSFLTSFLSLFSTTMVRS